MADYVPTSSTGKYGYGMCTVTPIRWTWADSTARLAQSVSSAELGMVGIQLDDDSTWMLYEENVPTWRNTSVGSSGITGSGTAGKLSKFIDANTTGDSIVSESGSTITVGGYTAFSDDTTHQTSAKAIFRNENTSVHSSDDGVLDVTATTLNIDADVDGTGRIATPKVKMTPEGGFAIKLTNKSGSEVTRGRVVEADTSANDAFNITETEDYMPIGVIYDASIADDAEGWVVVLGIADVAMEDNTAATRGYWVKTSDSDAGYADSTNASPPGGGVPELGQHSREIGHCIETVAATGAGTHILARCVLHFN